MQKKKKDKNQRKPRIVAVASFGGHLVQLRRITSALEHKYEVILVSTAREAQVKSSRNKFYIIPDFSRHTPWRIFSSFIKCRRIIRKEKPAIIISTGAAPGLVAILAGRSKRVNTLWIDSIANAERMSMCGRMAKKLAHETLTQWEHLADDKVKYSGTVM